MIYANPSKGSDYQFDTAIAEDLRARFGADVRKVNEVFFADSSEQLAVAKPPSQSAALPASDPPKVVDPTVEIVLKTLCESAAQSKEQEMRLRVRLAIALAKLAMQSEDWDTAAQHLQRACQIDPDSVEAARLMNQVSARKRVHQKAH